jgi:hypothetical protein
MGCGLVALLLRGPVGVTSIANRRARASSPWSARTRMVCGHISIWSGVRRVIWIWWWWWWGVGVRHISLSVIRLDSVGDLRLHVTQKNECQRHTCCNPQSQTETNGPHCGKGGAGGWTLLASTLLFSGSTSNCSTGRLIRSVAVPGRVADAYLHPPQRCGMRRVCQCVLPSPWHRQLSTVLAG